MDVAPPAKLDYGDYLDAIADDVATLTGIFEVESTEVRVPTCPGWCLADLAAHAGGFASLYTHRLCASTGAARPPWPDTWKHGGAPPLDGETPAAYFDARAQFLLSLLRATPPTAQVPTWNEGDQTAHFVARRSTHEFAVHRVDAQAAVGQAEPIDAAVAVDGIEEILMMLDIFHTGSESVSQSESLHLRSTDAHRDWLLFLEASGIHVTRQPGRADLMLAGTASDLELLLYGRPTLGQVDRVGRRTVLDAWYRTFTFI